MIKISIVMPVFNAEKFLDACLRSVLGQTLRDIEVLCVNDGSADASLAILRSAAAKDGRVKVIDRANQGASAARNAALKVAGGEYVAFMDADDLYPSENTLERLYAEAHGKNLFLCGGSMENLLPDGSIRLDTLPPYFGFTTYLYSRQLFADGKLFFPPYRTFEDPPFLVAVMARAGGRIGKADFPTYRYRVDYRPAAEKSRAVIVAMKDYLRGLADVANLSREAKLTEVHDAVRSFCFGQEFHAISVHAVREHADLLPLFCRLVAAFDSPGELPIFSDMQCVYRNCQGPMRTLRYALWLLKAKVGERIPDAVKFWRKATA